MNLQLKKYALAVLTECEESGRLAGLKTVVPLLNSADTEIRERAVKITVDIIKKTLFESYDKMEPNIRKSLTMLLNRVTNDVTRTLKSEIYSTDISRRIRAIQILGLVKSSRDMETYLSDLITDPDEKVRASAIKTFAEGELGGLQLKVLLSLLNDFDPRVKANTVEALAATGNENLIGILSRHKNDKNNRIRANVIKALWDLGYTDIEDVITEMLENSDRNMCYSAIWLIGEISRETPKFISLLTKVGHLQDKETRDAVMATLLKVDTDFAAEYMEKIYGKQPAKD